MTCQFSSGIDQNISAAVEPDCPAQTFVGRKGRNLARCVDRDGGAGIYVPACSRASASCAIEPRISAAAMARRMRQNFIGSQSSFIKGFLWQTTPICRKCQQLSDIYATFGVIRSTDCSEVPDDTPPEVQRTAGYPLGLLDR
jgi:hypothetical protein